jgi:hypothetical protein
MLVNRTLTQAVNPPAIPFSAGSIVYAERLDGLLQPYRRGN